MKNRSLFVFVFVPCGPSMIEQQKQPCLSVESKLTLTDRNMHAKKILNVVLKC